MDNFEKVVSLVILVLFLLVIFGGMYLSSSTCDAKTESIGMPHRWSVMGGCQIKINETQWLPLENYRYFGDER